MVVESFAILLIKMADSTGQGKKVLASLHKTAYCPMISKGEGNELMKQRALTVLGVHYRIWASVMHDELQGWQEDWRHKVITGGVQGIDAELIAWPTSLELEEAAASARTEVLALLDSQICFARC